MIITNIHAVQIMGITFSLILLLAVLWLVRERILQEKYSLLWFMVGLFTLIMSSIRELIDSFANLLGVDYAPSAFFAILISCAYLLLLGTSVSISSLKSTNKALVQELAITKLRIEQLEKNIEGNR